MTEPEDIFAVLGSTPGAGTARRAEEGAKHRRAAVDEEALPKYARRGEGGSLLKPGTKPVLLEQLNQHLSRRIIKGTPAAAHGQNWFIAGPFRRQGLPPEHR